MEGIGFMAVKRGDRVRRMLADSIPMDLYVLKVDERLIYTSVSDAIDPDRNSGSVWTFDRATGIEEDEDLGWGIMQGISGSRLVQILKKEK
jgi:hypothetical protein